MNNNNRSKFKIFTEDILGIRVGHKPSPNMSVTNKGNSLVDILDSLQDQSSMIDLTEINQFRTLSDQREYQYKVYDEMKADSIIAAALELYADDATQYNRDGSIIWIESDNSDIAKFGNRLIDSLNLNATAWSHIYMLCLYGDLYLETFNKDDLRDTKMNNIITNDNVVATGDSNTIAKVRSGEKLYEHIEVYPNPAELFDLIYMGKTIGFVKVPQDELNNQSSTRYRMYMKDEDNKNIVYDSTKFIHISLSQDITRFPEKLQITYQKKDSDSLNCQEYQIKRGKSILHDVYKIYQELRLMEDSLLLNRITRSSIIRLLQVEVGDMTKSQVSNVMKRLKQMMEQKNMINKGTGEYKSQASPGPIDNILYIPTRNGKGTVSMSNVGGDVDIKSIADIDYYSNKLYGGLKIPKQYLGGDDNGSALSNGTSLTKLDSRYARTIKRIQNAYIQGITTLINIYAIDRGFDEYVNQFNVKMVSPATTEDSERDESMGTRMDLISTFIDLLGDSYNNDTKKKVFEYFVSTYLNDNGLMDILNKDSGSSDGDFGDGEGSGDFSGGSDDFGGDFSDSDDIGDDFSSSDEDSENEENLDSSQFSDEDFGSFEDEA